MSSALDFSSPEEAELAAFSRMLAYGDGTYSSSLAICNSPSERDRIIAKVYKSQPGITILIVPARTIDVYGYVAEHCLPSTALFLVGLEASVASQDADSQTLRSLNASRDLWHKKFTCPVVIWLPDYAATALSEQARDFWRSFSHKFYFGNDNGLAQTRSSDPFSGEYISIMMLSLGEKHARILELESRLAGIELDSKNTEIYHAFSWWNELATLYAFVGDPEKSLDIYQRILLSNFTSLGIEELQGVIKGQIAAILAQRGDTDEALRIYQDEVLPIFQRHAVKRAEAVTYGRIANIFKRQGKYNDVLNIVREKELPVYESLGDLHQTAVAWGQIAHILHLLGNDKEAMRIFKTEQLPVFRQLEDHRSVAGVWSNIAYLLAARGELDEALRICNEDVYPVYQRLGDFREMAITLGQIAGFLDDRGETDAALRIYRNQQYPLLLKLEANHELVVCRANIAMSLLKRGRKKDRQEAFDHLRWASSEAESHKYAEAEKLKDIIKQLGPD